MKKVLKNIVNLIFNKFQIQNNKIVFESGRGLIDGNVRAVYNYIIENNISEFKIIWLVNKETDVSGLRKGDYAYYKTITGLYHLATAKYWIRSQSIGSILNKKNGQIYIQLWHGNGVMKKMGYDVTNEKDRKPVDHVLEWDYYIANDKYDAKVIRSSTGYNKKIDILGMACVDTVRKNSINNDFKIEVLNYFNLNKKSRNKKIILYAPTFRDFDLDSNIINIPIEKLSKLKDTLIFVRLHPLVRNKVNKKVFNHENIINACDYPDCSDLLAICDVLISDYSSIIYEYSTLIKPIIFYPYDFDKYSQIRGGFEIDYLNELPGPICYTQDELINEIKTACKEKWGYNSKIEKFNKKYNYLADGKASERFVNKLLNGYFK